MNEVTIIPLANLLLGFLPVILLITVMKFWGLNALQSVYANFRMLIQLLLIGYVLTYIFETDQPIIVLLVVLFMILMSSWIALRPLQERGIKAFMIVVVSLGLSGLAVLLLNESFQLYHSVALLLVLGGLWLSKDRPSRRAESTAN